MDDVKLNDAILLVVSSSPPMIFKEQSRTIVQFGTER